jgi:hypothetical protein
MDAEMTAVTREIAKPSSSTVGTAHIPLGTMHNWKSTDQQSLISISRSGSDGRIRLLSTMPVARDHGSRA